MMVVPNVPETSRNLMFTVRAILSYYYRNWRC